MSSAAMPWVKIYTEFIDDPKLGTLPDSAKLRFIQFVIMAGECDANGALVSADKPLTHAGVSWRLRIDVRDLETDIKLLLEIGVITEVDGLLSVTNFEKRQERKQSEKREKWRKWQETSRAKKRNVSPDSGLTHAGVRVQEKRREEKILVASATSEISQTPVQETSNVTLSQKETVAFNAESEDMPNLDALEHTFDRAMSAKDKPAEAVIRGWNAPDELKDICIAFAKCACVSVVKTDKGKWLAGAKRLAELHADGARIKAAVDKLRNEHMNCSHPGAIYETCKEIGALPPPRVVKMLEVVTTDGRTLQVEAC